MADKRKLQGEIDRTLKKVDEGVELFDGIWEKVYAARDPNHKEKYEQDLKKEIKKLQRHRDQIKTWLGGNEIKDKKALIEARKLIETKMEQFKVCEKEAKTKTFSKEGLAREQKIDPAEAAKNKSREWLQNAINSLNDQIESFDADLERLMAGKGKSKNKDEIANLEEAMAGHKKHVAKLEQIIRLMDNDLLDPNAIDELKEDIEYFVDSNQEPDYQAQYDDDQDMYESLDLDEAPIQMVDLLNQEKGPKRSPREGDEEGGLGDEEGSAVADDEEEADKAQPANKAGKDKKGGIPTGIGRPQLGKPLPLPPSPSPARGGSASSATARTAVKSVPVPPVPILARPPLTAASAVKGLGRSISTDSDRANDTAPKVPASPGTGGAPNQAAYLAQQQQQQQQKLAAQRQAQQQQSLVAQQQIVANQQAAQQQTLAAQQAALMERERLQQQQQQQAPSTSSLPDIQGGAPQAGVGGQQQQAGGGGEVPITSGPIQLRSQQQIQPQQPAPTPLGIPAGGGGGGGSPLMPSQPPQPSPPPITAAQQIQASIQAAAAAAQAQQQQQQQQQQRLGVGGAGVTAGGGGGVGLGGARLPQHQALNTPVLQPSQSPATAPSHAPVVGAAGGGGGAGESKLPSEQFGAPADVEGEVAGMGGAMDHPQGGTGSKTAPETLQMQMNYLNRAMLYIPTPHDAERPKQYFPRNPYPVNAAFPLTPAPIFETPVIFEKLGPDTLFFIFYYQQGTYQQYLAAKELKKQSWRYHKKYMTWFQRHEEPKITTDEFEQGTYVYFDCESGWCTRIKQEFTFEYNYLECDD